MAVETAPERAAFDWSAFKFLAFPLLSAVVAVEVAMGGAWLWAVLPTYVLIALLGDEALGDDLARRSRARAVLLDAYLYCAVPLALLVTVFFVVHAGGSAPAFLAAWVAPLGLDLPARVAATTTLDLALGALGVGLFFGTLVNVAHELVHRTGDRRAWVAGRWLLAHTLDTSFAIEHVHGHHRFVGTQRDPATARRGEYVLAFVWRSTIGQLASAWRIEAERLRRRGLKVWNRHNAFLTGQVMSATLVLGAWALGGGRGVLAFLAVALLGKVALELVNYVEHYGLARIEGTRVRPHHSWNCHNRLSSWILFNLPRHSDHHMFAARPYYDLRPVPELQGDAPVLPLGYLGCMAAALVPPVWNGLMAGPLRDWDERLATPGEAAAARARAR